MNKPMSIARTVVTSKTFAVVVTALAMYGANRYTLRKVNAYHVDRGLIADFKRYLLETGF